MRKLAKEKMAAQTLRKAEADQAEVNGNSALLREPLWAIHTWCIKWVQHGMGVIEAVQVLVKGTRVVNSHFVA